MKKKINLQDVKLLSFTTSVMATRSIGGALPTPPDLYTATDCPQSFCDGD